MILLIDNYDSFVHNLARYVGELGHERIVLRNDALTLADIRRMNPMAIILSPGPCTPNESGISLNIAHDLAAEYPVLGVCLGHQCIGQAWGAEVIRADRPVHGKASRVYHEGTALFEGLPSPFTAARYHSLVVSESRAEAGADSPLRVTARTADGTVMALEHARYPLYGVQFHPESILTEFGHDILKNFLRLAQIHGGTTKERAA